MADRSSTSLSSSRAKAGRRARVATYLNGAPHFEDDCARQGPKVRAGSAREAHDRN